MLKNFLRTAARNLLKNPLSSFINVFGLALAIGVCMVAYAYLSMEFGMEEQHAKRDKVFMLLSEVDRDGEADWYGISPAPIGPKLRADFPQIANTTRIRDRGVVVKRDANVFQESVRMVDPSYLHMFDFDMTAGSRESLQQINSVVLNQRMAEKYFGKNNAMGETIQMRFPGGEKALLTVTGIAQITTFSTCLEFDFLANYNLLDQVEPDFKTTDWSENISATFVELDNIGDLDFITKNMDNYRGPVNSAQPDWQIQSFDFESLATIYERSNDIRWDISSESDNEGRVIMSVIGLMMLILACVNYLNIAVASATKRLKEIGVRKVVGASRWMLVAQFITENLLLSGIALVTGIILAKTLFLPGLSDLFAVEFRMDVFNLQFFIYLIGMLLTTALASGAYPALYISKFQAVSIFRGRLRFGKNNLLTKIFLTIQFVLAIITVVCGITFTMNTQWQYERPWGYEKDESIYVQVPDDASFETFRNELAEDSRIKSVTGGTNHLGAYLASSILEFPDRKVETYKLDVEANYIETMGIQVIQGRALRSGYESDKQAVLINETFASNMGWEEPLGKTFRYDSASYTVAGVMKDFHYYSFWSFIRPVFLRVVDENYNYLVARVADPKQLIATFEHIENTWATTFPELPFRGDYQAQLYQDYFRNVQGHRVLMISIAIIAMILSCFGLYGLVSLNVAGRRKEFSIRKVLGARLKALAGAVSSHFLIFLALALLIGGPISYFLIGQLLDVVYIYHMPMSVFPVVAAILLIVVTVILTISSHILKVTTDNPVDGLRTE